MERKAETEISLIPESGNDERRKCWDEVSGEVKKLMALAGPLSSVNLLLTSLQFISLMFVGNRGGELSLSGASMATSFASVTGFSLMRIRRRFGYIMRSIIRRQTVPNAGNLYTESYASDASSLHSGGRRLGLDRPDPQAQNNVVPMMFTAGIAALVHVLSCWILVFKSGMGFKGAAMANAISYWVNVVLLGVYVRVSPSCKETWTGFSMDMFHGIIKFLRLGIPSTAMLCLENWSFELMVLLSGLLPNPKLETSVLSIAVRVSNEVGGGRPNAAWVAVRTALGCVATEGILVGIGMVSVHKVWGYVFSTEEEVVNYAGHMLLLLSASHFLDGLQCILCGTARGCGWQNIGAIVNLGAYYLLGIPAGILLAFVYNVGGMFISLMFVGNLGGELFLFRRFHGTSFRFKSPVCSLSQNQRGFTGALETYAVIIRRQTVQNAGESFMQRGMLSDASSQHSGGRLLGLHLTESSGFAGRQSTEISDDRPRVTLGFWIPQLFPYAILRCLISFLQAQKQRCPHDVHGPEIAALVHVLSCWDFSIQDLGWAFNGAAMANAIILLG
nr:protein DETOXIFICATION 16-like [Ipomoea batatas]